MPVETVKLPSPRRSRAAARVRGAARARRGAFTLVEMVVVIIILGVLAGVTLPRLFGNESRRLDVETQTVQRMLSIVAERGSLIPEPVAIDFDGETSTFRIMARRKGAAFVAKRAGVDAQPAQDWATDSLVEPVTLARTRLANAWIDGRPLPKRAWRVVFNPGEQRPALVLQIEAISGGIAPGGGDSKPVWQIALGSDDAAATRTAISAARSGAPLATSRAIDLDATGKGDKAW
ncbi:MAG: prepilin-type N-terminal cleavage/methylation domain-containing protein [Phycisphaerales bacterium]|nr:prepilin-type N-terminal cleavage/methylation domain-containing protein [Phycisphaerales bacterium]